MTLLLVSACSDDEAPLAQAASSPAATSTESASAASAAFPVSVDHLHGTTTIDSPPERVAAVGIGDTDVLLALGIQPVLVPVWTGAFDDGIGAWAEDLLTGERPTPLANATTQFSLEAVAAAEPDLIVAVNNAIDSSRYGLLSEIAPTVLHSPDHEDWVLPWQEVTERIGRAVGRANEAAELIARTEAYIEETAAENEHFEGRSGALVRVLDGNIFRLFSPDSARGQLLADLGFEMPSSLDDEFTDALFVDVALENLSELDLDVLIVDNYELHEPTLSDEPVFSSLDVVTSGGLVGLDAVISDAVSMPNPLTIPFALDAFVELINRTPVGEQE